MCIGIALAKYKNAILSTTLITVRKIAYFINNKIINVQTNYSDDQHAVTLFLGVFSFSVKRVFSCLFKSEFKFSCY